MGLFDNMLKNNETLFKNEVALDFSFQPKILKYRENEQRQIADCMKPLFQERNGKNIFVHGNPGLGKTLAIRKILEEIEEKYDDVIPFYINCWQKNTTYKIMVELCDVLNYKFVQNKKTEELMKIVIGLVNKKGAIFVFDEIDKTDDLDFLYNLLEGVYRKSIVIITNEKEWIIELDNRIKSRLVPDILEFKPYTDKEITGILDQRRELAFFPSVFDDKALSMIVERTLEAEDVRSGLHMMKEAGLAAEARSSKKITVEDVEKAISKIDELSIKKKEELADEDQFVLNIVKDNSGKKIGDLFKIYEEKNGQGSYKTFQRKIAKLAENRFLNTKKTEGGKEGNTTLVNYMQLGK